MLGRIAKLYYEHHYTHQQIADLLGWNRVRVTRALAEARDLGIVQISVAVDEPIFHDEEQALRNKFGLGHVWVAPGPTGRRADAAGADVSLLAGVGAEAIDQLVHDARRIAVGMSTTLAAIVSAVSPSGSPGSPSGGRRDRVFVPLQGTNPGLVIPPTANNIAEALAGAYGGQSYALAAPVVVASPPTFDLLRSDPDIRYALDTALSCDLALVGIGICGPGGSAVLRSVLTDDDADELRAAGAVGAINARFFDIEGRPVVTERTARVLGPSLEELTRIPTRIVAAAGPAKVPALQGALRAGLVTGLITDLDTARRLLER